MNSIQRYITNVFSDDSGDQMDIDRHYADRYLSQFSYIDRQTIDVMVDNGYEDREALLAFDLKEDLPLLPDLNMAQKSLLRKALKPLYDSALFEAKVADIKGIDDELMATTAAHTSPVNSQQLKRKRESMATVTSPPKRSRAVSPPDQSSTFNDGLGTKMRQMISARKSIRTAANATDDDDSDAYQMNTSPAPARYSGRLSAGRSANSFRAQDARNLDAYESDQSEEDVKPNLASITVQRERPSRQSLATPPARSTRNANNTGSAERQAITRTPTVRPPKPSATKSADRSATYVPTPTELEVRERLAQKKAAAKPKGRKQR